MRFVTCIVRERQLRLYRHVARFPDADPTHQILSVREPREWRRPRGRSHASWLQQVDQPLMEMGMGLASAWDGQTEATAVPVESGCSDVHPPAHALIPDLNGERAEQIRISEI